MDEIVFALIAKVDVPTDIKWKLTYTNIQPSFAKFNEGIFSTQILFGKHQDDRCSYELQLGWANEPLYRRAEYVVRDVDGLAVHNTFQQFSR